MYKKKDLIALIMLIVLAIVFMVEPVFAANCNGLLTPGAYQLLKDALEIIRIGVPILLIIFGAVDFSSVVISNDKDSLSKALAKFVKRCIAGVAIFFVPLVVSILIELTGIADNVTLVDDPICEIS